MFKQIFAEADVVLWPTFALIIFFSVMLGSIAWVMRKDSKPFYNKMAKFPLIQDEKK